ncbi:PASTA domain-containing protein [Mycolicibacterium vanbaalenii]|nr:PASTA domain-containing protein [Mycolicibacterium vanbaalenii]
MKQIALVVSALTLLLAACGGGSEQSPETVTVTSTTQAAPAYTPPAPVAPTKQQEVAPAPEASSWTMPNLIGRDLQAAQDAIQALTDYAIAFSTSTDLTGAARAQLMDRNWQVCSSSPPAGSTLTAGTPVDFGVVKMSEQCP